MSRKLPVASVEEFVIFAALFCRNRRGEVNGLKHSGVRVDAGGHNNIETNPVFRGMVRSENRRGLSTKGKLC